MEDFKLKIRQHKLTIKEINSRIKRGWDNHGILFTSDFYNYKQEICNLELSIKELKKKAKNKK